MTEIKAEKKEQKMDGTSQGQGQRTPNDATPKYTVGELLLLAAHTFWQQTYRKTVKLIRELKLNEHIDCVTRFLALHPFMAFFIAGLVLIFGLPLAIFSVLALTTALLTFMGIVLVEGTVITIASIIFFGFIACTFVIILFFGGIVLAGYFGFSQIYEAFDGNTSKQKEAIMNFLKKQRERTAEPRHD